MIYGRGRRPGALAPGTRPRETRARAVFEVDASAEKAPPRAVDNADWKVIAQIVSHLSLSLRVNE